MDVNGTRFHLVAGLLDWEAAVIPPADPDVCFDVDRATLGLRPRPFVFPTRPDAQRLSPDDRRGADVDRHGNHFWTSSDRRSILVAGEDREPFEWWPGGSPTTDISPPKGFSVCESVSFDGVEIGGLSVTVDQYLVVGAVGLPTGVADERASGLLVFDLAGGGPPVPLTWPAALDVRPIDLTAMPDGGVTVLDVPDPVIPGSGRLWHLDRHFRLVVPVGAMSTPQAFEPVDPDVPVVESVTVARRLESATRTDATDLDAVWPTAVEALGDGSVLVLDRVGPELRLAVTRWRCGQSQPFELRLAGVAEAEAGFVCTDQRANAADVLAGAVGHDFTVTCDDDGTEHLLVVDDRGDQAVEFVLDATRGGAELVTRFHPLRLFSGKALVSAGATAFYDLDDRWYPIPTRPIDRFAADAVVVLAPEVDGGRGFDAGAPGTTWHRLAIDASIPPGTTIEVETRAADDLATIENSPWLPEPSPYLRRAGSEIPYHEYAPAGTCSGQGTWELLFQRANGRYLQVRFTISGDRRRTPRIWSARLHFPRFSYLGEYLPNLYREDRESASFLDRYLANVEGLYTTLEGQVSNVRRVIDPTTIDTEYLPWLASWVGAVVEPDWEPARQRLLVRHAARLFTRRGTQRGLIEAIRLATHPCPSDSIFDTGSADAFDVRIVESFRTRSVAGIVFGNPNDLEGPGYSAVGSTWELSDGRAQLDQRWSGFLSGRHEQAGSTLSAAVAAAWGSSVVTVGDPPTFPVLTPTIQLAADDWHDFVRSELSFAYPDVGQSDRDSYQRYLAQRYQRIDDYRSAWGFASTAITDFSQIELPVELPSDGIALEDWIVFVSSVLPMQRAAHRATVLVPIRFEDSDEARELRLGRVRRVVEVERPAHTVVDVIPYWAACRVGETRVGFETIVGEGSRYVDLVLGAGRLAHAAAPGGSTWRLVGRVVAGRERIERSVEPAGTGGS